MRKPLKRLRKSCGPFIMKFGIGLSTCTLPMQLLDRMEQDFDVETLFAWQSSHGV